MSIHTKVRGRRGKLVHALTYTGERKDLAPEDVPMLVCGKRMKGVLVTDDHISCPQCTEILWNQN
jgi:hypothetical protein